MGPLVSIIVPIYNMEDNLPKCISSIINQVYKNIEIILINDGSTDNSAQIINTFAADHKKIRLFHKKNEGVSVARNIGIVESSGEYLMFVDPDDFLHTEYVSTLLEKALTQDADIVACCAQVELDSFKKKNSFFKEEGVIEKKRAIAQLFSNEYYNDSDECIDVGVPWAKIYRKNIIVDNELKFNPKLRRNQDNIFNLYAFQYSNKIIYIDRPLYHYDIGHYKSGTRKVKFDAELLNSDLAKECIKYYKKFYLEDLFFSSLLLTRLTYLLLNVLTTKLCNPNYDIEYKERIEKIKYICELKEFRCIFENKINVKSMKHKIVLNLLKSEQYSIVYIIYYFAFKIGL